MEVVIVGGRSHGRTATIRVFPPEDREAIEAALRKIGMTKTVVALHNLQKAFEQVTVVGKTSTEFMDELKKLTEAEQSIVFDKPQSKFMSKPKNNFRKR